MDNFPVPIESQQLRVIACPHPFRQVQECQELVAGKSLRAILLEAQPDLDRYQAHVWVNDAYIPPEQWDQVYPAPGSDIAIRVIPRGPVGRLIGAIFVAIAAIAAAMFIPWMWPSLGLLGNLLGAVTGMTVSFLGNMLLNVLIPPTLNPERQEQLRQGTDSPTYSLAGGSNTANKYGPVPKILGRHKVFPLYGAEAYTEIVGNDQYLRLFFVYGIK